MIPFGFAGLNVAHASVGSWFGGLLMDTLGFAANTVGKIAAEVLGFILEYVWLPILSWILVVVGNLLDQAINFSLNMSNISGMSGVKDGWIIVRDFINLSFIFFLLNIAIRTILGVSGSADKKILGNLVLSAIFINFSMFIAGVVIDAGNIVALAFRNAIITTGSTGGLGTVIMNAVKVAEFYSPTNFFDYSNFLSAAIRSIVFATTIYALFLATLLFIVRIISFIILLILSPIGFVGTLTPKFAEQSKKWWTTLINQTLVAPIFLFFFYIIARITAGNGLFKNELPDSGNINVTYYFNFIIIIGLILTAVKLSKQFSGELGGKVANFAGTLGKMALGAAGAATIGGLAVAGRAGLGRGASVVLSKTGETLNEMASKGGVGGFAAKIGLKTLRKTEKASFDIRGTETGKKILSLAKGVSFGKGKTGGFESSLQSTARKERDFTGDMTDAQKESYAQNVLEKPLWAIGKKIDPDSLIGKISKKVSAGGSLEKMIQIQNDPSLSKEEKQKKLKKLFGSEKKDE